MNLGIIARADSTGLGVIGWEFCRNLKPKKILGVDLFAQRGYGAERSRLPGAEWAEGSPISEAQVEDFLDGLDTVLTFETAYGPHLFPMARARGVKSVLVVMPEYLPPYPKGQAPDLFVNPTPWRADRIPSPSMVLPIPIAFDRFRDVTPRGRGADLLRVVHPAGRIVGRDRNGTKLVEKSLPLFSDCLFEIRSQTGRKESDRERLNYWETYEETDLLVLPRRYGGLCLPMQEAAAAGIPTVLLDVEPYRAMGWPTELLVPARVIGSRRMRGNPIDHFDARPQTLARYVNAITADPGLYDDLREKVFSWAKERSWGKLSVFWESALS